MFDSERCVMFVCLLEENTFNLLIFFFIFFKLSLNVQSSF